MKEYLVEWKIEIDAETPEEAAKEAWHYQQAEGSTAVVFDVYDEKGEVTRVDLLEGEQ